MKSKFLFYFILSSFYANCLQAQGLCDSTYAICDSITIDSIFITHFPVSVDRIHIQITSNHNFLHGPIFLFCASDDDNEVVRDAHAFSGIVGPISTSIFYDFLDFSLVGDTLEGHVLVNNAGNSFSNCVLPFKTSTTGNPSSIDDTKPINEIDIYPNPASDYLIIRLIEHDLSANGIRLFDLMGREQKIKYAPPRLDLSQVIPGLYILELELNNSVRTLKKIIIQ